MICDDDRGGDMEMKQVEGFERKALKVSEVGYFTYHLWVDGVGKFYVRIIDNDQGGKFSDLLYSVEGYADIRNSVDSIKPEGYKLPNMKEKASGNNNDGGFLKAKNKGSHLDILLFLIIFLLLSPY
jgi:hypothetical protein